MNNKVVSIVFFSSSNTSVWAAYILHEKIHLIYSMLQYCPYVLYVLFCRVPDSRRTRHLCVAAGRTNDRAYRAHLAAVCLADDDCVFCSFSAATDRVHSARFCTFDLITVFFFILSSASVLHVYFSDLLWRPRLVR